MHKANLYKKLKNNALKCTACNHYCQIRDGQTGICGVRKNINDDLFLLVYGKPVAINVDPIEKKPLFHFMPKSSVFSIGTYGCNFKCLFCQNWDISQLKPKPNFEELIENCPTWLPEQIVEHCKKEKFPVVAYTYTEPTIFAEYAFDTMKLANKNGIKNVFVSNGFESIETIEYIHKYLDAINIDLKSFSDKFYRKICGGRLQPVLNTIKNIYNKKIWQEITTLVIPGENDSPQNLHDIAAFIASIDKNIPWHISAFSPAYKMQDKETTPYETLENAYKIGKENKLNYVYIGNVITDTYSGTSCHNCKTKLIDRKAYFVTAEKNFNGKCPNCQTAIPGIW